MGLARVSACANEWRDDNEGEEDDALNSKNKTVVRDGYGIRNEERKEDDTSEDAEE